jgi:hypothetical protein
MIFSLRRSPLLALALTAVVACASPSVAQTGPTQHVDPGVRPVTRTFAITNARVVQAPGRVIDRATVVIRDGIIEAVGPTVTVPFDADVIEGDTLFVYAGFIDALGTAGVRVPTVEPERVRNPDDPPRDRSGLLPDRLTHTFIDPGHDAVEQLRRQGFTVAHVAPAVGFLSGQSAVILLAGATPEVMVVVPRAALVARFATAAGVYPSTPMGVIAALRQAYRSAERAGEAQARYDRDPGGLPRPVFDPVSDALQASFNRQQPVFFVADNLLEGHRALALAGELGLRVAIAGVSEPSMLTDRLRRAGVPVVAPLALPDALPAEQVVATTDPTEDLAAHLEGDIFVTEHRIMSFRDLPGEAERLRQRRSAAISLHERGPLALHDAGIPFAFGTHGMVATSIRPNLRRMIAAGLTREAALAALTTTPAEILGLARSLGTVEPGKMANLVVTDGDYFEEGTRVRYVFIDGQRFHLEATAARAPSDPGAEVGVLGTWDVTVDFPEEAVSGRLIFEGTADALRGTLDLPPLGTFLLDRIQLEGNRLSFLVVGGPGGTAEASGVVATNTFEGELRAPGLPTASFTATRRPD